MSGFCRRTRRVTELPEGSSVVDVAPRWTATPPAHLDAAQFSLELRPTKALEHLDGAEPLLVLNITLTRQNVFRLRVNEVAPLKPRFEVPDVLLEDIGQVAFDAVQVSDDNNQFTLRAPANGPFVKVTVEPFSVALFVNNEPSLILNARNLFHFEHMREQPKATATEEEETKNFHEERIDDDGDHPDDEYDELDPLHRMGDVKDVAVEDLERVDDDGDVDLSEENYAYDEMLAQDSAATLEQPGSATTAAVAEQDGWWQETFGSHTDSKPHGPTAVSFDAAFVGSKHVYGIPEHATDFALKPTRGPGIESDPYRLYNLDVFEYELDETMALYGAVPLMMGHSVNGTVGLFWLNAAEMWIDVDTSEFGDENNNNNENKAGDALSALWASVTGKQKKEKQQKAQRSTHTHWIAETGIIDVFLMPGPTPQRVLEQYYSLTGLPSMPPTFAMAYHQCRWNYRDEDDVRQVNAGFNQHQIPYDVLWLDIEHTDGKRYFTWDQHHFGSPKDMLAQIGAEGRKMVTIVDPHLKRDDNYGVYKEALERELFVRNADNGSAFDGWCWPGSSSWPDFARADVREWWASRFAYDKYEGSAANLFIWNDMNEMSVFSGPEVTMGKDMKHLDGVEHRELHNAYGLWVQQATAEGLVARDQAANRRPFVLSRALFAGTQRWGAIWTGDNKADWAHLRASVPMLLSLAVAGIPFAGADVGGFFGNVEAELLTRWFQVGAFQPFFRSHAHLDAKRREPWLFGEPYTSAIRSAIRLRYQHLPLWTTLMHAAHVSGAAPMRPLWFEFPGDTAAFAVEDQFLVGNALLVKPVGEPGQEQTSVYLPKDVWFDVWSGEQHDARSEATRIEISTPLERFPLLQRGGTIIPRRDRVRRSSVAMRNDPFTLVVALKDKRATGELFVDDDETIDSPASHRQFEWAEGVLSNRAVTSWAQTDQLQIERVLVRGFAAKAQTVKCELEQDKDKSVVACDFDSSVNVLRIGPLRAAIGNEWKLRVTTGNQEEL